MKKHCKVPAFHRLTATRQLECNRSYPHLLPYLTARGLAIEDALAVAYNVTLLAFVLEVQPPITTPMDVLSRYSLDEVASLCEAFLQVEAGTLEYGQKEVSV